MTQDSSAIKVEHERHILSLALPLLRTIYGYIRVDENQRDRPDAAFVQSNGARITVEITSLDRPPDMQYIKDTRHGADIADAERDGILSGATASERPIKNLTVSIDRGYLFDQASDKAAKYTSYLIDGATESILLTHSEFIFAGLDGFFDYYIPMAGFLFHKEKFPFSKVIFVCKVCERACLVYDRLGEPPARPPDALFPGSSIEIGMTTGRIGEIAVFSGDPLIKLPTSRKKRSFSSTASE